MTNKNRNILIGSSCVFLCLLCLSAFLLFKKSVTETKQATVERINGVGDNVEQKIDATAKVIKEDYAKTKEAAVLAKEKAKVKYQEWKEKREQQKSEN
jgi:hypothetical protein